MINHPMVENVADFDSRFDNFLSLFCRLADSSIGARSTGWVVSSFCQPCVPLEKLHYVPL